MAYLTSANNGFNIYGFNGKHLGWFDEGLIINHDGYVVGFQKGAVNMYTKYEPYKSYKKYKPYKSYKQYAPYKPFTKNQFSSETLSLFLMRGKNERSELAGAEEWRQEPSFFCLGRKVCGRRSRLQT